MIRERGSFLKNKLAKRVQTAGSHPQPIVPIADVPLSDGLLAYIKHHLSEGETHYTARPGMVPLRRAIGQRIADLGGPDLEPDGIVVTSGEAEALFVTLLGLDIGPGSAVAVLGPCRHRELFRLMGVDCISPKDDMMGDVRAAYAEFKPGPTAVSDVPDDHGQTILALGSVLFSSQTATDALSNIDEDAIAIGELNDLPGLDQFRIGYAFGAPARMKQIMTWKQALSICSPGPSQRAALFAVSREPTS